VYVLQKWALKSFYFIPKLQFHKILSSFRYPKFANFLGVRVRNRKYDLFFINPQLSQVRQSANHKSANFSFSGQREWNISFKSSASFRPFHGEITENSSEGLFRRIFLFTTVQM
jgi:hypothetical protein